MTLDQALGIASTFDKIMTILLTSPDVTIESMDPFTKRHMNQLLKWNTEPLEKVEKCIPELVHEKTLQRPDAEAICAWDGSFTYAELDRVSSRLAHHLVKMGVDREIRVPLCFDKSVRFLSSPIVCWKKLTGAVEMESSLDVSGNESWGCFCAAGSLPPCSPTSGPGSYP